MLLDLLSEHLSAIEVVVRKLEGVYVERYEEEIIADKDLEDCRFMLRDALQEMVAAYKDLDMEIPQANCLIEQIPIEVHGVSQTA